ncbi:YlxR family protein [Nodosilinea sp. E11]|uniref:YlxR family protein n=1 Tax=Nodosilinea sp. E11 TaxID=3037479 RepID=UPI0029344BDD|nr:YlxR family protein [Nodosilinea sp. E11]WOD37632.1 YlxR family protein [Nodosilinea sp. E11]
MQPNHRCCVSCRRVAPKAEFWRVVRVYPDRTVVLGEGMGRSAYICPQAACLRQAQKKGRLGRALKANVPEELYQTLWQRLEGADQAAIALLPQALSPSSPQP